MLKFKIPPDLVSEEQFQAGRAYLVDAEDQPLRGDLRLRGDTLFCDRKGDGPVSLVLPLDVPGVGRVLVATVHLPDREAPYNLLVEVLRGLVLRAWRKKDDWGYAYRGPTPEFASGLDAAKARMARAMGLRPTDPEAGIIAREAIADVLRLSEELTLEHARRGLLFRCDNRELAGLDFGCWVDLSCRDQAYLDRLFESFNYAALPMDWRVVEPREHEFQWAPLDFWVNWLTSKGIAIKAAQLLRFRSSSVPDWVYLWEGDFDSIRDYAFEHALRCVQRYASKIEHWDIATGLHVENCLKFSLDQVIEMTTMCCRVVKKNAPHAKAVLDLVMPWGEYAASNARSLSPLKYVEACINAGVEFDAIGLQVFMGADGYPCRDIMAISALLDQFGGFGRPLHVTAAGVPSSHEPDPHDASQGKNNVSLGGYWHEPWTPAVQARWVDAFYNIAVGKPFVEAVCWTELSDRPGHFFPHAGLLDANLEPKASYAAMLGMRREIWPETGIPEHRAAEQAKPWAEY